VLAKCANPECSEVFLYLHQGKIFHLSPTPKLEVETNFSNPALHERFWLCDRCAQRMKVVWAGTHVKLLPLPADSQPAARARRSEAMERENRHGNPRRHFGGDDGLDLAAGEGSMSVAVSHEKKALENKSAFRHILVATDFSEPSHRALCDALAVAAENDAHLSVVHVLQMDGKCAALKNPAEPDRQRVDAERQLEALAREVGSEKKVDMILVKHGPVAEAVATLIEEAGVDLLVIGTRARGGLRKIALGSVADELLRAAPCPVMTIGPKADIANIRQGPGFHRILFATDFGPGSAKALPLTIALARASEAKLILLHMIAPMPANTATLSAYAPAVAAADELEEWEASSRKRVLRQLRESLPEGAGLAQEPEYVVGTDFLAEGVLTAVVKFKVDLIVMGANRTASARAAAHLPWTAVHEVVRNAPCPVLTVAG